MGRRDPALINSEKSAKTETKVGEYKGRRIMGWHGQASLLSLSYKVLALIFALFMFSDAFGQSTRYYKGSRSSRLPERVLLERKNKDYDFYLGKVVRSDGKIAVVNISGASVQKMPGRIPMYYALDEQMRPVAVLEETGFNHKTCVAFRIAEGEVKRGDLLMVKYLAERNSGEALK